MHESIWSEWSSRSLEELVLELDPVETEGVQEGLEQVHAHQDCESAPEEYVVHDEKLHKLGN